VIFARVDSAGTMLSAELPEGSTAWVDGDWLPAEGEAEVPHLLSDGRSLAFSGGGDVPLTGGQEGEACAAAALLAVASASAAAVAALPSDSVEVNGRGFVAEEVRRLLGGGSVGDSRRPLGCVDTTGSPDALVELTGRVEESGVVALAGEPLQRATPLNLYADVHRRGLTLVGVPPPLEGVSELTGRTSGQSPPATRVALGALLPPAVWYRIDA
jgi:hypothetical protein